MVLSFVLPASIRQLISGRHLLIYDAMWTALLTVTVTVVSFAPETAFVWAISPSSVFSRACVERDEDAVRIPLGEHGEVLCFPAKLFRQSAMDLFVTSAFAVIVAAAAFVPMTIGMLEDETD